VYAHSKGETDFVRECNVLETMGDRRWRRVAERVDFVKQEVCVRVKRKVSGQGSFTFLSRSHVLTSDWCIYMLP